MGCRRLPRALRFFLLASAVGLIGAFTACDGASGPAGGVRTRWYRPQADYGTSRPAVLGDLVYFGTGAGTVVARQRATGAVRWSAVVGARRTRVEGANFIARGGVVAVPIVGETVGLDAQTGRELWRYYAPGPVGQVVYSRIDADDEAVYVPAWGASVSAVDLRTGQPRWVWQPGKAPTDTAAAGVFRSGSNGARVSGDTVYATAWHYLTELGGRSEAWVVALDRVTGAELWRVTLPVIGQAVSIQGAPAVAGGLVIVTVGYGQAFAISPATRQIAWTFQSPAAALTPSAQVEPYGDVVYHDGGDSHIYALRAADGAVLWKSRFPTQATRDLLVTDRRVTFSEGRNLYVLDRQTGRQVAAVQQPGTWDSLFASPAAAADGQVFVTVGDAAWSFAEP